MKSNYSCYLKNGKVLIFEILGWVKVWLGEGWVGIV